MKYSHQMPKARTQGLLVEELADETLVYDLKSHEAHCLNQSAAFVWKRSDGRTTVAEMTSGLCELGLPAEESVVLMALERLERASLLDEAAQAAAAPERGGFTRKEVLRVLGAAAGMTLLLPAVDSVVAPLAASAASCLTARQCNAEDPNTGCSGLPICGNRRQCCKFVMRGSSATCSPNQAC